MAVRSRLSEALSGQGVSRDLAVLAGTQAVAAFGAGLIIPLLAPLLAGLPAPLFPGTLLGLPVTTELQVGILFSVFGIARSGLQVPMGRLSDHVGLRKPFLEAGMLGSAATLYAYGLVGSVGALMSVRVLQGVALAVSTPALFAIVEGVTERGTRGGSMGFFSTMRTLGWGLGPVVGGLVVDLYGMGLAFALGAGLTALAVAAVRLAVPEVPPGADRTEDASAGPGPSADPDSGSEDTGGRLPEAGAGDPSEDHQGPDVPLDDSTGGGDPSADHQGPDVPLDDPAGAEDPDIDTDGGVPPAENAAGDVLWLFSTHRQASTLLGLGLALVTLMMGFSAMIAMENPILERIGGTKAGFGVVFAITTLVRLVVQFPVGVASDRYGRKRFIVWGLLASAPLVGLMGFADGLLEFVALRGVLGVALAGVIAPAYALAADVVDDARSGEQLAVVTMAFSVGFAVGPILAGGVAFLGFAVPFLLAAVLTVAGGLAVQAMVTEPA